MTHKQFSLRLLFVVVTCVCIVSWSVAEPAPARVFCTFLALCLAGAVLGSVRGRHPIVCGVAAGAGTTVTVLLCRWLVLLVGYYEQGQPADYFENGFVAATLNFPISFLFAYTPIGAALGGAVGCVVWIAQRCGVVLLRCLGAHVRVGTVPRVER